MYYRLLLSVEKKQCLRMVRFPRLTGMNSALLLPMHFVLKIKRLWSRRMQCGQFYKNFAQKT